MHWLKRSSVLLGAGAGGADLSVVMSLGVPVLTSWQAKDLVDNRHPNYFGSPGIYGQRCANKVLHHSDLVLAIGNRLAIWNVGYEGIRKDQHLIQVEIDGKEIKKGAEAVVEDARSFIEGLRHERPACRDWLARCSLWREDHPWLEKAHEDANGYINSYRFVHALQDHLAHDEVIVTEMGAPLMAAHQILKLKPPQRLMTSGGLGEMGCGLPAAIGASLARNKGRVICLSTDGGLMFNLQELQTIVHHQLPIKIIVFNNGGYGMLKHTQDNAGMKHSGVDEESGVSFPNFRHVAIAFGITAGEIRTWEDFHRIISGMLTCEGPCLVDYRMDPRQKYVPKLEPIYENGVARSPGFDEMSP
jgi:acetolactate synthase-1/2/3 large subunit